ncbi:hypothetical protein [Mammaliicoccus sp. JADD-157]|uniref:hypothetical protein n=1 Tax=Mammaliicoccus sp. JADD-157 TaxID=3404818 RepID=UPI003BB72780
MKKKWEVYILAPEDWNFSKLDFIGIKINSDDNLSFESYEDALDFINSINPKDSNISNLVKASYRILENESDNEKVLDYGVIYIPHSLLSEEMVDYYLECQKYIPS